MAFAIQQQPQTNTTNSPNDSWKAAAFVNLWVKRPDGSKAKIGAIALRNNKKFEAALIKRLQEEGAIEALKSALEIDFQVVSEEVSDVGF
ncbi:MAG: hypothetical protein KC496_01460 [Anaerolineae bacterium]|nr:hypothetical protein [Anaerolineae bacterium]